MPTNSESLNRELFRLLSRYKSKPLDAEGKVTPVPEEADVFKFEFTKDGEDYGTVYVTIDEERVLTLYYGDDVADSPGDKTPGLGYDDTWWGLHDQLSAWRMTKGLRGFKTQNKDRVGDDMARRNHMRNKDKIAEGYYPMGKSRSYSDAVPSVKIVIEHSRVIEEGEQRYRNINRIFLENQDGERYLLDTKKPGIARVYARHIAEGGKVNDDRWNHVHSLCEEYSKMAGFVRATRNGQFNESAQSLVNEGIAHYQSLRESLSRMTGKRGYNSYFESWTPSLMEDGTEENNLNELFVQETLDPRIESVMPILNRIHKKVSESIVDKEMNKLAEWADSLVEEESLTSNNPGGIPESKMDEGVLDSIKNMFGKKDQTPIAFDRPGSVTPEDILIAYQREPDFTAYVKNLAMQNSISPKEVIKQLQQSVGPLTVQPDYRKESIPSEGMEEAINTGASLQRFRNDPRGNQKLPATPAKEVDEIIDYDTLNQLASHPMAGPLAAAGGAAIGATIGKGITKAANWYKNRQEKKAQDYDMRGNKVAEEVDTGQYDAVKSSHKGGPTPKQEKSFREKVQAYGKELEQRQKEKGVAEGDGNPDIQSGMKVSQGTVEKVDGNIVTVKTSNGDMITMNIHDVDQAVAEDSHEEQVARLAAYNERMAGENPPIDLGLREVGNWAKVGHYGDPIKTAWYNIAKYGVRNNRFKDSVDQVMSAIGEFPDLEDEVYDMYDINQDEVDILYDAYETVYDQWEQSQGATNENFINQVDQAVTSEGEHTQHAMRGRNPGANEFEHDFEPEDKIGNIHDKISKMLKRLEKPKHEPSMKDTDLGNTLHEAAPWEDEDEEDKDDKKPKDTKGSDGSEHGGHSRAKHLAKNAIPKDDKKEVSEGQDELARILTIMNHRR